MNVRTCKYIILILTIIFLHLPFNPAFSEKITDQQAKSFFEEGEKSFDQKKYKDAIKQWMPLVENKKISAGLKKMLFESYQKVYQANGLYIKGIELYRKKYYSESKKYFSEITNIYPVYPNAKDMISLLEKYLMIEEYYKASLASFLNRDYSKTIDLCKKILSLDMDNQEAQNLLKQALLMQAKETALEKLNEIDQLLTKGVTFFSNKEYSFARGAFTNALKLDNNNIIALNYLNSINQILLEQYNEKKLTSPQETMPEDQSFLVKRDLIIQKYLQIASVYLNIKQYTKAVDMCQNILLLQSGNSEAKKMIKQVLLLQMQDKNEEEVNDMITRGITFFSNKQFESARQIFTNVLKINPGNYFIISYLDKINQPQPEKKMGLKQMQNFIPLNLVTQQTGKGLTVMPEKPSKSFNILLLIVLLFVPAVIITVFVFWKKLSILYYLIIIHLKKIVNLYKLWDKEEAFTIIKKFPGTAEKLEKIRDFIHHILANFSLSKQDIFKIQFIVDETCSNIIRYYEGKHTNITLDVTVKSDIDSCSVIIEYQGLKFNPLNTFDFEIDKYLRKNKKKDWGIYFIRKYIDDIEFHHDHLGNHLIFTKYKK